MPEPWRSDRQILSDCPFWTSVEVAGDEQALLLRIERPARVALLGRGDPAGVAALVARYAGAPGAEPVGWMSVPRGCRVTAEALGALGLRPAWSWDWLSTAGMPSVREVAQVVPLDRTEDLCAIRDCLAEANPTTSSDPTDPGEIGWWGVRGRGGRLDAVMGAARRGGPGPDAVSWHLHGLGVRPERRGQGVGEQLAGVVTRAGLEAGAAWVALGMYADNDQARRVYHRLGYTTDIQGDAYRPEDTRSSPA